MEASAWAKLATDWVTKPRWSNTSIKRLYSFCCNVAAIPKKGSNKPSSRSSSARSLGECKTSLANPRATDSPPLPAGPQRTGRPARQRTRSRTTPVAAFDRVGATQKIQAARAEFHVEHPVEGLKCWRRCNTARLPLLLRVPLARPERCSSRSPSCSGPRRSRPIPLARRWPQPRRGAVCSWLGGAKLCLPTTPATSSPSSSDTSSTATTSASLSLCSSLGARLLFLSFLGCSPSSRAVALGLGLVLGPPRGPAAEVPRHRVRRRSGALQDGRAPPSRSKLGAPMSPALRMTPGSAGRSTREPLERLHKHQHLVVRAVAGGHVLAARPSPEMACVLGEGQGRRGSVDGPILESLVPGLGHHRPPGLDALAALVIPVDLQHSHVALLFSGSCGRRCVKSAQTVLKRRFGRPRRVRLSEDGPPPCLMAVQIHARYLLEGKHSVTRVASLKEQTATSVPGGQHVLGADGGVHRQLWVEIGLAHYPRRHWHGLQRQGQLHRQFASRASRRDRRSAANGLQRPPQGQGAFRMGTVPVANPLGRLGWCAFWVRVALLPGHLARVDRQGVEGDAAGWARRVPPRSRPTQRPAQAPDRTEVLLFPRPPPTVVVLQVLVAMRRVNDSAAVIEDPLHHQPLVPVAGIVLVTDQKTRFSAPSARSSLGLRTLDSLTETPATDPDETPGEESQEQPLDALRLERPQPPAKRSPRCGDPQRRRAGCRHWTWRCCRGWPAGLAQQQSLRLSGLEAQQKTLPPARP